MNSDSAPNPGAGRRSWLRLALVCLLLPAGAGNLPAATKRVLVVHSFGSGTPPFTTHSIAFETELTEKLGQRVDLDEISLDMARYADLDMQEALVEYLLKRQAKWAPDLVVPIGSPAAIFVAQYQAQLFPTTPILYTGLDIRRLPPDALRRNAAFVGEDFDIPALVEDMLEIAPATTNIAVVIGASPLENYWRSAFQQEFAGFTNRVSFTWLHELAFDQMLNRVSELPPRSFIFLILLLRDAAGVSHNADEALRRIHAVANAPINSIFVNQLGLGIVGGRLYPAEQEGVESARLALRILNGEAATNLPPQIIGPLSRQYDWRELQRWNISERGLPPGSTVLFREPTAWDRYRRWIIGGISLCVVQAGLIFGLLAHRVQRRRAELSLMESRNRLRAILDTAVEGIITFDDRGVIESVNLATERIFGYAAGEMVGLQVRSLLPASSRGEPDPAPASGTEPPPGLLLGGEVIGRRKDGTEFPLELAVSETTLAHRRVFTGLVRDITDRKQAEQAAREFGGRLLHAQEAERARLARELHDDITQRLARLAIDAGRAGSGGTEGSRDEALRSVRDGLVRLSEDVHALSYRLHPALLEDLGLVEALRVECERFARQESVPVEMKLAEVPAQLARASGLCLFRVTQEALRNVARHARAQAVKVSLRRLDDGLQLAVVDDGIGFDLRRPRQQPSLGLASMHERVRLLGGELDIESSPGCGTTVVVWLPLTMQVS